MTRVEGENTGLRHYLARLHRQTLCYSKSREMLGYSIRLLIHYLKFQEVPIPYWFIAWFSNAESSFVVFLKTRLKLTFGYDAQLPFIPWFSNAYFFCSICEGHLDRCWLVYAWHWHKRRFIVRREDGESTRNSCLQASYSVPCQD
jgi:hypothetical protein